MFKSKGMNEKAFLGMDASKGYADFLLLDDQCKVLENDFQLPDTSEGRKCLKQLIARWQKEGLKELYCGIESTGGYENNWFSLLKGLRDTGKIWVSRLNPKAVKSAGEALMKRTVTDSVSAGMIAAYLVKYPEKVDYGSRDTDTGNEFKEDRQFVTGINLWVKQKVQLSNQLEKLLYQQMSELLIYCRHGAPMWLLAMLTKYPSVAAIKNAGVTGLSKIKGITKEKAESIVKKIRENDQTTRPAMQRLIQVTATEAMHQQNLVETNRAFLNDLYKDHASVKLLRAIKGIGIDSAVSIVLEIEDVNRFADAKKMVSFFGLNPTFKQSGDGLWGNHLSKKGRGRIRSILYMTSLSAVRYNPLFKKLYARLRAKNMVHKKAMGAVMHKMLRVIYGVLKSGKPFDQLIDIKNQEQAAQRQEAKKQQKKEQTEANREERERFQNVLNTAPISNTNYKKRKKQLASQSSEEANTGLPAADTNI